MSENEQEIVPVKLSDVADGFKIVTIDKLGNVHNSIRVAIEPPEFTFGYCFRTAGKWLAASAIYAAIGWIVAAIIYQVVK